MTSFAFRTRSVRLTITPPQGDTITIENLAFNDGYEIDFAVRRDMSDALGEARVTIYNLPTALRGQLEAAQVRKPNDLDEILAAGGVAQGWQVYGAGMAESGADALAVGFPLIRIEAGYDGALSTISEVVGARIDSRRDGETTYITEISGSDALDAVLFAKPVTVFEPGTPTYDVMNFLRSSCGLGIGNVTPAQWDAIVGTSTLSAFFYSTMGGIDALRQLLDHLPLRWWIDERDLYVIPKDGQPYPLTAPPPYVPDAPTQPSVLLSMPRRIEGGMIEVESLLAPAALPGRLLLLSPLTLGLEGATPEEIDRVEVPPGLYRIEEVDHEGTTSPAGNFDTRLRCKRVLA